MSSDKYYINGRHFISIALLVSVCKILNRHTMRRKFESQRDPQEAKFDQFNLEDFVTWGQLSVHV